MTKIICDKFGIYSACEEDFIVKEAIDYENALNLMKQLKDEITYNEAIHNKEEPEHNKLQPERNIVVRNPAIFHWFDSPARQFDCQIIKLNPVTELKKLIKQSNIPANLNKNPQWILELSLLDKAKNQSILHNENSLRWLQRVLIGEVWQYENLDTNNDFDFNISNLISWLSIHKTNNLHPFIETLIINQLTVWGENHPDKADLFKWLVHDPFSRSKMIIWEQYLDRYPLNKIAGWFQHDNIWHTLNLLPNRKKYISLIHKPLQLPENISIFVKEFLEEQWNISPIDALSFINANLEVERIFLANKLRFYLHQGISLGKDVYDKIVEISDKHKLIDLIDLAKQLIPAKEPSLIDPYDSIERIQQWLKNEYLPFYRSSALLKKLEQTTPYIDTFQEWLKINYPDMLISGKAMAYSQIYKLKPKSAESPILIYLCDGLDYLSAEEELLPDFESMGAYCENALLPHFAFLPTETFIAKPTVVCGLLNSQIPQEQPDSLFYHKLLQSALGLNEDDIRSATDKDASIQELIQEPARVYLFLDNQLDREYLHSGLSPYIRIKKYAAHLKKQAKAIIDANKFIKKQYDKDLLVLICSDHGYTELPQNLDIINIESTSKTKTRSIFYSDIVSTSDSPTNNVKYIGDKINNKNMWRLKAGLFGLNKDMVVPDGYKCFFKRPKGAVHGGATPQEIAVPWFLINFQKQESAKAPIISIQGEIFRRRKENELIVTIANINNYQISIVDIIIKAQTEIMDFQTQFPFQIEQQEFIKLKASFNAVKVNDMVIEFNTSCYFSCKYGEATIEKTIPLETKGSMVDDFDDEFEF